MGFQMLIFVSFSLLKHPKGPNPTLSLFLCSNSQDTQTMKTSWIFYTSLFACTVFIASLHSSIYVVVMAMTQFVTRQWQWDSGFLCLKSFFLGLNRLCSSLFFIFLCGFDGGWTIFVSWENVVFHEGDCFGCMFLILVGWLSWLDVLYFYKTLTFWSCFHLSLRARVYIYIYIYLFWEERDIKWE